MKNKEIALTLISISIYFFNGTNLHIWEKSSTFAPRKEQITTSRAEAQRHNKGKKIMANAYETHTPSYLEAIEDCEDIFGVDEEIFGDSEEWELADDIESLNELENWLAEIHEIEEEAEMEIKWENEILASVGL